MVERRGSPHDARAGALMACALLLLSLTGAAAARAATGEGGEGSVVAPTTSPSELTAASDRAISLQTDRPKLRYGETFTLTGTLSSAAPGGCAASQPVEILRTVVGTNESEVFDTLVTDHQGAFIKTYPAEVSANLMAHVDPSETCAGANSRAVPVLVRVAVGLKLSEERVQPGDRIRLEAKVSPCTGHEGDSVVLFQRLGRKLAKVDTASLGQDCSAGWSKRIWSSSAFEVRWPSQEPDHLRGRSAEREVQVRS